MGKGAGGGGGVGVQLFKINIYLLIALKLGGVMCRISSAKIISPFYPSQLYKFYKF
jgi:hypothetical protein